MAPKKETKLEVGSPEWREAKIAGKAALDARLGTARNVVKRDIR